MATEAADEIVAANLRRLRHAHDLSMAQLAERSGVAVSTLSRIEAGGSNPRLETLWALAASLSVPLGELVARPAPPAAAVVRAADAPTMSGTAVTARLMDRVRNVSGPIEIYDIELAASEQRSQAHAAGTVEHLLVVSGHARVGPVNAPVELGPGDHARFLATVPHIYQGLGGTARGALIIEYQP